MTDEMKKNELTEEQLKDVAGGKIEWGNDTKYLSREAIHYQFEIGQRVESYRDRVCGFLRTRRRIITDRSYRSNGLMGDEARYFPIYCVEFDDGGSDWFPQNWISL